jgi:hypothetical protein
LALQLVVILPSIPPPTVQPIRVSLLEPATATATPFGVTPANAPLVLIEP